MADFQAENGPNDRLTIARAILSGASWAKSIGNDRAVVVRFAPETKKGASAGIRGAILFGRAVSDGVLVTRWSGGVGCGWSIARTFFC